MCACAWCLDISIPETIKSLLKTDIHFEAARKIVNTIIQLSRCSFRFPKIHWNSLSFFHFFFSFWQSITIKSIKQNTEKSMCGRMSKMGRVRSLLPFVFSPQKMSFVLKQTHKQIKVFHNITCDDTCRNVWSLFYVYTMLQPLFVFVRHFTR